MKDFAADVQAYLEVQGLVGQGTLWPSTIGAFHDETDRLVQIAEDSGPEPEVHASTGMGDSAATFPTIVVTVRGEPHERTETRDRAASIYDALHSLSGPTLGSTLYIQLRARSSEFARVYDDQRRPRYSMTYQATAAAV